MGDMEEDKVIKTNNEVLSKIEAEVIKKAEEYKQTDNVLSTLEAELKEAVSQYNLERRNYQLDFWEKVKGLGWCQRCEKFRSADSIVILYTQEREEYSDHAYSSFDLYHRIRGFCKDCSDFIMSLPRGEENEFQCFKAKKGLDGSFMALMSGTWKPVPEQTIITVERGYIPEKEFLFGKSIEFKSTWPRIVISVENEDIMD